MVEDTLTRKYAEPAALGYVIGAWVKIVGMNVPVGVTAASEPSRHWDDDPEFALNDGQLARVVDNAPIELRTYAVLGHQACIDAFRRVKIECKGQTGWVDIANLRITHLMHASTTHVASHAWLSD